MARGEGNQQVRKNTTVINVKDIYEKVLAEEAIKLCSLLEGKYSLDDVENMFITRRHRNRILSSHKKNTWLNITDLQKWF